MSQPRKVIRASELGAFTYCQRAWWYGQQNAPNENNAALSAGSAYHQAHGKRVFAGKVMQAAGWMLLCAALIVLAVFLAQFFHL